MTKDKDFKRLVRARMQKTGEAYTTARAHVLARGAAAPPAQESRAAGDVEPADTEGSGPGNLAARAAMSEESVRDATGRGWAEWVAILDAAGASDWTHREMTRWLAEHHGDVSGWWIQSVTVGYERIKGLRDVGQRRSGEYEINKSRTIRRPLEEVWTAWADPERRAAWLDAPEFEVTSAREHRSLRMAWPDGTRVQVWFTDKGDRCSVAVQHGKLPDPAAADRTRTEWHERLDALQAHLDA
ncbi:MAG: hypothetical protein RJQ04_06485 [Longimicrobiales bacterium]